MTNLGSINLSGKLLVAMPGMGDPRFDRAVILICAHTPEGAMGLIVNKPADEVSGADLLSQLGISQSDDAHDVQIHIGGPVENGRGFVLHTSDYCAPGSTLEIDGNFGMTASVGVLEELAAGSGPSTALLMLGYSGWGPGQLEDEIGRNGWLTCDAAKEIVFEKDSKRKWAAALKTLGIDPLTLSASSGRA